MGLSDKGKQFLKWAGGGCALIGLIDLPDQIQRWAKYLASLWGMVVNWDADLLGNHGRWFFSLCGIALLLIAYDVPGRLWNRFWPVKSKQTFSYFYLYRIHGSPHAVNGEFQLAINVIGGVIESVNYWISPWGVLPNGTQDDPYYSLDKRKPLIPIIHQGGRAWDRTLPLGDYRIDFTTKYGNWYERLIIYAENGQTKERIKVTTEINDAGSVLYEC